MTIQVVAGGSTIRQQVGAEVWRARVDLAAGHRVLAQYGVNDLTYNHFSLRVPGEPDHMLVKRTDEMFCEVTASSVVEYDLDGNPVTPVDAPRCKGGALILHAGLLKARRDIDAVLHTHTPSVMGVSAHKFGLLPINQHAMRFYGELKYHDFKGFEFEPEMTRRVAVDLDGGRYMLLRNHGALICGNSVAECVVNHHWLEMACQGQVAALAAGEGNVIVPDPEDCAYAHQQFKDAGGFLNGDKDWQACLRLADRLDPSYKE